MNADLLHRPEPQTLRLIGAVFWMGLLVYFVPQWFMHPVSFSPQEARAQSQRLVAEAQQVPMAPQTVEAGSDTPAVAAAEPARQELFIDKPLTTTPPPADPQRAQALYQPPMVREAQTDREGRLKAASEPGKLAVQPPAVHPGGGVWVQVATYTQEAIAQDTLIRLKGAGFPGRLITQTNSKGRTLYVLRVGPYKTPRDGNRAKQLIDERFKAKSMVIGK